MKHIVEPLAAVEEPSSSFTATPAYVEIRVVTDYAQAAVHVYFIRITDHAFLLAGSWGHQLDTVFELLQHPKYGQIWLDALTDSSPTIGRAITNGVAGRFSDGAFVNIEDPDDGDRKWVLATVIGNVWVDTVEELEALLHSDRVFQAYQLIVSLAHQVEQERETIHFSAGAKAKMAWRGMLASRSTSVSFTQAWIPRIMDVLIKNYTS